MNTKHLNYVTKSVVFFYFNVTSDASFDECVRIAINKAWQDATAQGAYNTKLPKEIAKKDKSNDAQKNSEDYLKKAIDKVDIGGYDKWHKELCREIRKEFFTTVGEIEAKNDSAKADISLFSYGNAQKWVNMTMKYLYFMSVLFESSGTEDREKWEKIRLLEPVLHAPVDSYIIEALWCKEGIVLPYMGKLDGNGFPIHSQNNQRTIGKGENKYIYKYKKDEREEYYNEGRVTGWSCWSEKIYDDFHNSLTHYIKVNGNGKSEIEWESDEWIEIAQKREREGRK